MDDQRKRIVLAVGTEWGSGHGGLSTFNRELCLALARNGHRVYCYIEDPPEDEVQAASRLHVELLRAVRMHAGPATQELMLKAPLPPGTTPDIVIGHGRVTGQAARAQVEEYFKDAQRIHFLHVIPEEISPHTHPENAAEAAREREMQERNACKGADLVVGVGPLIYREMGNLLSAFANKPKLVRIDPPVLPLAKLRKPVEGLHILVMGRVDDISLKGIDIAVLAASRAAGQMQQQLVLIVRGSQRGLDGKLRDQLLPYAKEGGEYLSIRVRPFTTDEADLQQDLQRASLLLMPSRSEGFGLSGLEAVQAGTPILITNRSGLAELIHERLGQLSEHWIVDVNEANIERTVDSWARRIQAVLSNRDEAFEEVGLMAQALAKGHSWEAVVNTLLTNLPQKDRVTFVGDAILITDTVAPNTIAGGEPTIRESLASAVRHPSREEARALMHAVTKRPANDGESAAAQVVAFRTLATFDETPERRLTTRRRGLAHARRSWDKFRTPSTALAWADTAVDAFYDHFAVEEPDSRDLQLRDSKKALDEALKSASEASVKAALLSQKSSVLGCQATVALGRDRDARLRERLGCAKKAIDYSPSSEAALIALGHSEWMAARWTKDHLRGVQHLNTAELALRRAAGGTPLPHLVLCRFWRLTHRPLQSMRSFLTYVELEQDVWRRRAEAHLLGETCLLLHAQGFDQEIVTVAAQEARKFLQDAISAGIATARTYIAMANTLQLLGLGHDADSVLGNLRRAKQGGWMEVLAEAMSAVRNDRASAVDSAFILGLAEASVWNQLGVYSRRFANDLSFARACWETGLRLKANDPELLTNLARSLAYSEDRDDLVLATNFIERAASCADRTWRWWRPVRNEIDESRRRLGLSPLPRAVSTGEGWSQADAALEELRRSQIDAASMLEKLSVVCNGVSFAGNWIETGDVALYVQSNGPTIGIHGWDGAYFDLGLEQFEEVVNGRVGLAGLIERCVYSSFPSSQQFYGAYRASAG